MRRLSLLLASTAIAFGLGAGALAQTGPGTKAPAAGDRFRTQLFERLDADKDGKITKPEFEAARQAELKAADKNADGSLSKEEFAAYGDQRRAEFVDRLLARFDKNRDGKITAEEFAQDRPRGERGDRARERGIDFERADAAKKGHLALEDFAKARGERYEAALKRRFERLDTNRDGKLESAEIAPERREAILRADANKDGAVTLDEFAARPRAFFARRIEAEFKAIDANGDGKLVKAEADAARGKPMMLLLADANRDGAVTKEELAASFSGRGGTMRDRAFEALDADKDGKISPAEWQAGGERRFARMDRNKDGAIAQDEVGFRGRHQERRGRDR